MSSNRREVGATQRLVHFMDRVSAVNFAVVVDVDGRLDADTLRRAALDVQRAHPLLRVRVLEDGQGLLRRTFFAEDEVGPVEVRELDSEIFDPRALAVAVEAELARHFDVAVGPLFRLSIASESEERHRLLLTMHHVIADGASAAIVVRDLLEACGADSPPAIRPLGDVGPRFTSVPRAYSLWLTARLLARAARHLARVPAGRNVPGLAAPARGRETGVIFNELSRDQTASVIASAKAMNATVGGVLSAALARAVYETTGIGGAAWVPVVNAVDVRSAQGSADRDDVDLLMSFVVTYHRLSDRRPFEDLARECAEEVRRSIRRGDASVPHTLASLLPSIDPGEAVRATIRVADRFATSAAVTNVGRIELPPSRGSLLVTGVTFAPSLGFLGRFSGVAATFDGRLAWNFAYVKQVVGRELANELAERAMGHLRALI